MGLDMYLNGNKFYLTSWDSPEKNIMEDGFRVKKKIIELGYWRKHPDLHGYIVEKFADGIDECQEIELLKEDVLAIIGAVNDDKLPHTEGFFFGESSPEDKKDTIDQLEKAIKWIDKKEDGVIKSIIYRASW